MEEKQLLLRANQELLDKVRGASTPTPRGWAPRVSPSPRPSPGRTRGRLWEGRIFPVALRALFLGASGRGSWFWSCPQGGDHRGLQGQGRLSSRGF